MKWAYLVLVTLVIAIAKFMLVAPSEADTNADIARGKYLVAFGSCNDCHTPGWREADGKIPVAQWMTGSRLGYRGPWGTSYPTNVRLDFQTISEQQWLAMVRTRGGHWPMVWHDLRELSVSDQRAIYRFVRSLGPRGTQVPAPLYPDQEPSTPFIWIAPQTTKSTHW